jgi:integrase
MVYKAANVVIRDLRRTTATRWDASGLPRSRVSYLLGHAGGMTGRYVVDDLDALLPQTGFEDLWDCHLAGVAERK